MTLESKANAGDIEAMFLLGEQYDKSNKHDLAYNWYNKASENGHKTATRYTAWALKTGTGTIKNIPKAIELYKKCATEYNDPTAQACLGFFYQKGEGVDENIKEAINYYQLASDNGNTTATVNLALLHEKGQGTEKNQKIAFNYFLKAANNNNCNGIINVGLYYEKGEGGCEKDMKKAFNWYYKAAELKDPTACAIVGCCFEKGEGTSVDRERAIAYYTEAATMGNPHGREGLKRLLGSR